MPSFWAQFKETKEWKHTKPVHRLTFTWPVKRTLKSTVWHFVYQSVNTAVLSKREDRFSGILEWTFLVIKNITLYNLRYRLNMAPSDGLVRGLMSAIPTPNIICNRGLLFTKLLVGRLLDTKVTINGSRVSFDPNKTLFFILLGSNQEPPHSHCKQFLSLVQKPWIEVRDWLLNIYLLSQLSVRRI